MGTRRKDVTPTQKLRVIELLDDLAPKDVAPKVSLSLSEVYKIRREHRKAQEKGPSSDVALGPHRSRLFYFAQRVRDRLNLRIGCNAGAASRGDTGHMWDGWDSSYWADAPRDPEESGGEDEWGSGPYDARTHPLFPLLRQHLHEHQCWRLLEDAERIFDFGDGIFDQESAWQAVRKFQDSLSDDLLSQLLLHSRCNQCP